MKSLQRFLAIFIARNLEFFRDKATLIWNIMFPVFLIFGFAFAFSGNNQPAYKIGVTGEPLPGLDFLEYRYVQFIAYPSLAEALDKLTQHQLALVLDFRTASYYINQDSRDGYIVEKMLAASGSFPLFSKQTVNGENVRYIDWFVPGVIGMNIMFSCLMGVGYVLVRYRHNGVLKRFKATPVHALEFITAQLFSRFFIVAFMSVVIYTGTNFFLHFQMRGSYFDLFLVTALAILSHISLGLIFATRFKSEEVAGGVINIVLWPMLILSGIFFSLEGTPALMQALARVFPITHFLEAARAIMLEGAGLLDVAGNLLVLAGTTLLFLVLAALAFKWE